MSRTFNIPQDPFGAKETIYTKDRFTIECGLTVVVGCNGTGKTTLLQLLSQELRKDQIPYLKYDNLTQGGETAMYHALLFDKLELLAELAMSSEGEQIVVNLSQKALEIGKFVKKNQGAKEIWILIDAVDSGLSVDNVIDVKKYLFGTMMKDLKEKNTDCYIVVSANAYEMCNGERCFDARNGEYVTFADYGEYRNFILKSKDEKRNRRN